MKYEYKVVTAPTRVLAKRAVAQGNDPAPYTIEVVLNEMGVGGWEYVRSDRVMLEKRSILGRKKVEQDMLVFRRAPRTQGQTPTQTQAQAQLQAAAQSAAQPRNGGGPMILTAEQIRAHRNKPRQPLAAGPRLGAVRAPGSV
jgi:hypothetical protein